MSRYVPETFPHQWLPEKLELKTWEQIEPWYQKLMDQPIESAGDLERWLGAAGELNAAVGQEGVERHVAMTCQTDDPEREAAYLAFVREIEPKLKPHRAVEPGVGPAFRRPDAFGDSLIAQTRALVEGRDPPGGLRHGSQAVNGRPPVARDRGLRTDPPQQPYGRRRQVGRGRRGWWRRSA